MAPSSGRTGPPSIYETMGITASAGLLRDGNVLGLVAFRPLFNLELHHLALRQRFVAIHLNRGEMDKNVFSRLALDESIPLRCIEPLHDTLFSAQLLHSSLVIFAICRV